MDPNVSTTMNVFLIIANIINIFYNIPQMVHTYKTKSTKDFDVWFIILRIVGNIIWLAYAIDINNLLMLINNSVTVFSSLFIGYYKFFEKEKEYRMLAYNKQLYDDAETMENA
jgi:MtN3 and saliva related transmembrane protein